MKKSLIPILACPHCQGAFTLRDEVTNQTEITAGALVCSACGQTFFIEHGVPNLLACEEVDVTQQGFIDQWSLRFDGKFENREVFGMKPDKRAKFMLARCIDPVQPGEWIVDVGCGSAEITQAIAVQHPEAQVVGFDFSPTLQQSAQNALDIPNLHFVQGNVMHPPFKPHSFMKLFAIGVLHHTPDTAAAFQATAPLVAPGGRMQIWIYPNPLENLLLLPYYSIRDINFLGQGHRLPAHWRLRLSKLHALPLLPPFALTYNVVQKLETMVKGEAMADLAEMSLSDLHNTLAFFIFDDISPEYQFRHKKQEVMSWFKAQGFAELETNHFGLYSGKRM